MKYCKVMFGTVSGAKEDVIYKINDITVAQHFNKDGKTPTEMGGFNYTTEDAILRWLHRGDTIYDVKIPKDAVKVKLEGSTIVYRTNKIIISNPRKIDDNMALHYYKISKIPLKSYYKALAAVSVMGYKKTAYEIIKDKIRKDNIDLVIDEWNDFISHGKDNGKSNELVMEVNEYLREIKSDLLISRFIYKEPYIKELSNDKVINITGESGSGKSTYTLKLNDNYIILDTDEIFSNKPCNLEIQKIRDMFINKYGEIPNLIDNFDICYKDLLDYYKDSNKTIVIDSAQFRNIKDISLLKGQLIVMRTDIETCYLRCIERFTKNNKDIEEREKYKNKKAKIFDWYHSINKFLERVDKL